MINILMPIQCHACNGPFTNENGASPMLLEHGVQQYLIHGRCVGYPFDVCPCGRAITSWQEAAEQIAARGIPVEDLAAELPPSEEDPVVPSETISQTLGSVAETIVGIFATLSILYFAFTQNAELRR